MNVFKNLFKANFFTTGLAMFAMFFGSGNLIFPVAIGQFAGVQTPWALLGLFLTAILMPFVALIIMLFLNSDHKNFFSQVGFLPGKLISFIILALIGPFGVLPRCIAFSYSTFALYFESLNLTIYCFISCVLILILSYRKSDVVGVIGNVLTPVLIISLIVIIIQGLSADNLSIDKQNTNSNLFIMKHGFIEGYKTFDIFAALFFAAAIIPDFNNILGNKLKTSKKAILNLALKSSLVGAGILFFVYAGLSLVAANLRGGLIGVEGDKLLGVIAAITMGDTAGLLANIVVSLACLTTAISLALVSSEFFKKEIFLEKVSYEKSLLLVMVISFLVSLLGFSGIMTMVLPVLKILCPAVIVLILATILKLIFNFSYAKQSFYSALIISLLFNLL